MRLLIKVVPNSSRERISGWMGDRLKVQVVAPPERGRANTAVEELLALSLGLPFSAVRVVEGGKSARKTIEIDAAEGAVYAKLPPRP